MRFSLKSVGAAALRAGLLASAMGGTAAAQTWTPLNSQPSFNPFAALLLTDGTIAVQDAGSCGCGSGAWWKLTPDKTGSYINGTWSQLASLPSGYTPLYHASQVLTNGQVIFNGGEYNGSGNGVWTTKGALYDPPTNTWSTVTPPKGWSTIGDAQSILLTDGTYMLANCCTTAEATYNLTTQTWTATGTGKADTNDEEGWTLLPSGQVLTVDTKDSDPKHSEILTNGAWTFAGDTVQVLPDKSSEELGPAVLRPDGTVFQVGATGYTGVYSIKAAKWKNGPTFPKVGGTYLDEADGPASLLPDGNVLVAASPGVFQSGVQFFEFDGKKLNPVPATPNSPNNSSFNVALLLLPTGQVMQTDFSGDVEIYTPTGTASAKWAPKITSFPSSVTHGTSYTLTGKYLSGWSGAVAYGDDYQAATNYPLVRITNTATGDVAYARTTGFSSVAVVNKAATTASVAIPSGIETGASTLVVVTNGIASKPMKITIN
jgi:hypothetical protein